ncbi:zinc-dependent peptidase [Methylomicrobium agile]|uniref:M90 family metallopeptidase n=1 Tax=Methylomicrobium agile TaxID=39774 RepID=UPI0004DED17E|nr:M90 family metallopeptidase [Methylomicrobium agile]
MNWLKRARLCRILRRHPIPHSLWRETLRNCAPLRELTAVEKARLRELATLFLYEKEFSGVQGLALTDAMRLRIAALACLPVLGLGFGCLAGWREVIVYPADFRVRHEETDEAGVVHPQELHLCGESWSHGPLILSWDEIEQELEEPEAGRNVVIHEIAHKLDMLNGPADGYPPLHYRMPVAPWSAAFSAAYAQFVRRVDHGRRTLIDPYAADSPAEFFAVVSEYFFCAPEILQTEFAAVYEQLSLYYRQNPLLRKERTGQ